MRRYERASTIISSNRLVEGWGELRGDVAAVAATFDRLLHRATRSSAGCETGGRVKLRRQRRPQDRSELVLSLGRWPDFTRPPRRSW